MENVIAQPLERAIGAAYPFKRIRRYLQVERTPNDIALSVLTAALDRDELARAIATELYGPGDDWRPDYEWGNATAAAEAVIDSILGESGE